MNAAQKATLRKLDALLQRHVELIEARSDRPENRDTKVYLKGQAFGLMVAQTYIEQMMKENVS